jgi:uncharacterized membrane protein YhaH (DUF805 family)
MEVINNRNVNIKEATFLFFKNYFLFSGRSSRGAYWWQFPVLFLAGFIIGLMEVFLGLYNYEVGSGPFGLILQLAVFIPGLSVTARRLHDVGRSGWWYLIAFTVVGIIPLFYWMCKKGDLGTNKYGEDIEAGR